MLSQDLNVVAPEAALAVAAMVILMWGAYAKREVGGPALWVSCLLLVAAGLWVGFQPEGARMAFDGSFVSDGFARFSKVMILFGAAAALALSHAYLTRMQLMKFEYPVLILLVGGGHDDDGLGAGSDRALRRAGVAEPGALRRGRRSGATACARRRRG